MELRMPRAPTATLKNGLGPSNTAAQFGTLLLCQISPIPNFPLPLYLIRVWVAGSGGGHWTTRSAVRFGEGCTNTVHNRHVTTFRQRS